MTLEERLKRRLQEYRKMAAAYREAEAECNQRAKAAEVDDDPKAESESQQEAELNQAAALAFERVAGDLAHDLAARAVRAKRRKTPPGDLKVEAPF